MSTIHLYIIQAKLNIKCTRFGTVDEILLDKNYIIFLEIKLHVIAIGELYQFGKHTFVNPKAVRKVLYSRI